MARKIGLQMYTVRESAHADFLGTLREIASIGYQGIETAGILGGLSPAELKSVLDDLGLTLFGGHVSLAALESGVEALSADYAAMGAKYLALAWLAPDLRNAAGYARAGRALSSASATAKRYGLTLLYHNHDFELEEVDGQLGLDHLLAAVGPDVKLELDLGWIVRAGADPVDYVSRFNRRAPLVHIKDVTADLQDFAVIGEGCVDFGAVMAAGDAVGVDWFVVEQDRTPRGELVSVRSSYENLVARGWLG